MNTTTPNSCLDAQDLAAMVEGKLDEARRPAAITHLASCEECREAVEDGVLFARQMQRDSSTPVTIFPVSPQPAPSPAPFGTLRWGLGLAAAAALAVAVLLLWPQPPSATDWVAWIDPSATALELGEPRLSKPRGDDSAGESFLVGVHLVRMAAAEKVANAKAAATARQGMIQALGEKALEDSWPRRMADVEAFLSGRKLDGDALRFGQWAESGRLMAASGAIDELRRHPARQPDAAGLAVVRKPLKRIAELSAGDLDAEAVAELEKLYGNVTDLYSK